MERGVSRGYVSCGRMCGWSIKGWFVFFWGITAMDELQWTLAALIHSPQTVEELCVCYQCQGSGMMQYCVACSSGYCSACAPGETHHCVECKKKRGLTTDILAVGRARRGVMLCGYCGKEHPCDEGHCAESNCSIAGCSNPGMMMGICFMHMLDINQAGMIAFT